MRKERRFLHFPIALLKGFMEKPSECLDDIFCYAVFSLIKNRTVNGIEEFEKNWDIKISSEDVSGILKKGEILYNRFLGTNFPYTGLHLSTYYRYQNAENELENICLLAFLALKSIIQIKSIQNIKMVFLLSRMAGSSDKTDNIPEKIKYWMESRYRRDQVFHILEKSFGLVRAYKARGITYSFTLSHEVLERAILERKFKKSRKALTVKKRNAKNKAEEKVKQIYQTPSIGRLF